ncbi:DUF3037 domain-containing protein [Luteimonas sp. YGD11-2]|uniref:DUF3037 domain-containing protein n=1 Tax=Luteimonas sp. YGD11-2 TaxID=2508168 RepID=UPI00100B08F9|nr:DUF3037 domain-containing protein [Luteimonas sp. YGD11-2]
MHAPETYDYAVVRVVPRVERGEFINAGLVMSCERRGWLQARIELDHGRLRALWPDVDVEAVEHALSAIPRICIGGADAGPIGLLPLRARFHWLTAQRSAVIQTSPVHMGRCADLDATMERLLQRMVRT